MFLKVSISFLLKKTGSANLLRLNLKRHFELNQYDEIGDRNGDHTCDGVSLNCEQSKRRNWADFFQRPDQFDDSLVFTRARQVHKSFHHIIETCMEIIVNIADSSDAE